MTASAEPLRLLRVVLAFAVAPLAAATLFGLLMMIGTGDGGRALAYGVTALVPAAAATLVIGVPAYLLLKRRVRPTMNHALAAGALLGMMTVLVVFLAPLLALRGQVDNATDALPAILALAAAAALVGALAGWLFWVVAVWRPSAE